MSEYQYYEFQALDRPLTQNDIAELRRYSTRARITPTSFVNDYSWGSFKGNANAWMEKYFDAFLQFADWGARTLKFRLPSRLLDVQLVSEYAVDEYFGFWEKDDFVILSFNIEDDARWDEEDTRLADLISIRDELARGDLRALYLAWLSAVQFADHEDESIEPPVPPGLSNLSASLESFVDFLRLDRDLIEVAARASSPWSSEEPGPAEVRAFVAQLPTAEKDEILARILIENGRAPVQELLAQMRRGSLVPDPRPREGRSVAELVQAAEELSRERSRVALENALRTQAERERRLQLARSRYLDSLVGKEPAVWQKVQDLIGTKLPKNYDEAIGLLRDLRDLDVRNGGGEFAERMEELRDEHVRKASLMRRLSEAGL